ncbi:MAG: hypothetical protein NVSMB19_14790 [Vulcanimicrobiaceae bacterium]
MERVLVVVAPFADFTQTFGQVRTNGSSLDDHGAYLRTGPREFRVIRRAVTTRRTGRVAGPATAR